MDRKQVEKAMREKEMREDGVGDDSLGIEEILRNKMLLILKGIRYCDNT